MPKGGKPRRTLHFLGGTPMNINYNVTGSERKWLFSYKNPIPRNHTWMGSIFLQLKAGFCQIAHNFFLLCQRRAAVFRVLINDFHGTLMP